MNKESCLSLTVSHFVPLLSANSWILSFSAGSGSGSGVKEGAGERLLLSIYLVQEKGGEQELHSHNSQSLRGRE